MEAVICKNCKKIGYTASPKHLRAKCSCGGSFMPLGEYKNKVDREKSNSERGGVKDVCIVGIK